jgi:hypothetical protein
MTEKEIAQEIDDPFAFDEGQEDVAEETTEPAIDPKELAELREFKQQTETEKREAAVADAFTAAGLSPKAARLFIALDADVDPTPELVKTSAADYDLGPPPDRSGYTPTVISGGHVPLRRRTRAKRWKTSHERTPRGPAHSRRAAGFDGRTLRSTKGPRDEHT